MATAERKDPFGVFNFRLEIDGIQVAGFSEVTGFGASTDPIEYREGGDNTTNRKLPGPTKYPNIVMKWGLTTDRELYDWYLRVTKGIIERRDGHIGLYDLANTTEVVRWNFREAWPTKWDGPDFSAKGTDVAIETLELAHEYIERA